MNSSFTARSLSIRAGVLLALAVGSALTAAAANQRKDVYVLTSTNSTTGNSVLVFELSTARTPALSHVQTLPTGGLGGAGASAGGLQFLGGLGVVVNYGSNTVTQLVRRDDNINIEQTIKLAAGCTKPVSAALKDDQLFVVGANCIESHAWPSGIVDARVVRTPDASAGQVAVGRTWAAATFESGSVWQLPLTRQGSLAGTSTSIALPADANNTPIGAAFWGDILGITPAHSPDSFAVVNTSLDAYPVQGPAPAFPNNAPCWIAKGPGNIWYTGNSPGQAISIFFSDDQGGTFYKSVALPGTPTDLSVSPDGQWLGVIYTAADGSGGRIGVYSIDRYGDLTLAATSPAVGVASFDGIAFSE
jgi:hypothetical protein